MELLVLQALKQTAKKAQKKNHIDFLELLHLCKELMKDFKRAITEENPNPLLRAYRVGGKRETISTYVYNRGTHGAAEQIREHLKHPLLLDGSL